MTGTLFNDFEAQPRPFGLEDNMEILKMKREFDYSSTESLERSFHDFKRTTEHYISQYTAIIRSAKSEGNLSRALAINECLLRELKLRAVVAYESAGQAKWMPPTISDDLLKFGAYLADVREPYKKDRAELSRAMSESLEFPAKAS